MGSSPAKSLYPHTQLCKSKNSSCCKYLCQIRGGRLIPGGGAQSTRVGRVGALMHLHNDGTSIKHFHIKSCSDSV